MFVVMFAYLIHCLQNDGEVQKHEPVSYTHLTLPTTPYV